jgi:4-amino-4-deoxychorismate lyase
VIRKSSDFDGKNSRSSDHLGKCISLVSNLTNVQPLSNSTRMKVFENSSSYDYSFPAVTLAYFLRYPNPYSKHVLCTDVIDRYVDPSTKRLHTTRLHLKRSKVPTAMAKLLPVGLTGPGGAQQSYVIEKSTVDVREGWMETESRNMEWTGILSVIERQTYRRCDSFATTKEDTTPNVDDKERTSCNTVVSFKSRLGQAMRKNAEAMADSNGEEVPRQGFFASWSTAGIQRTIELVGVKRSKTAIVNGKNGMNVVLERLRSGGVVGVLEGMRRDHIETMGGQERHWKRAWNSGSPGGAPESSPPELHSDHADHNR